MIKEGGSFFLQVLHLLYSHATGGCRCSKKRWQVLTWKICGIFTVKLPGEEDCPEAAPLNTMGVGLTFSLCCSSERAVPTLFSVLSGALLSHVAAHNGPSSHQPFAGSGQKGRAALFSAARGFISTNQVELGEGKRAGYQQQLSEKKVLTIISSSQGKLWKLLLQRAFKSRQGIA